jgi:hypothetical protein
LHPNLEVVFLKKYPFVKDPLWGKAQWFLQVSLDLSAAMNM